MRTRPYSQTPFAGRQRLQKKYYSKGSLRKTRYSLSILSLRFRTRQLRRHGQRFSTCRRNRDICWRRRHQGFPFVGHHRLHSHACHHRHHLCHDLWLCCTIMVIGGGGERCAVAMRRRITTKSAHRSEAATAERTEGKRPSPATFTSFMKCMATHETLCG